MRVDRGTNTDRKFYRNLWTDKIQTDGKTNEVTDGDGKKQREWNCSGQLDKDGKQKEVERQPW